MLDSAIDRVDEFISTHKKLVSVLSVAWMGLTCAIQARFISLPDIPFLTDKAAMWLSIGFNAVWWGFLVPRIDERRKTRASGQEAGQDAGS